MEKSQHSVEKKGKLESKKKDTEEFIYKNSVHGRKWIVWTLIWKFVLLDRHWLKEDKPQTGGKYWKKSHIW